MNSTQRIFSLLLFTPSVAYGLVNLHDAGYSDTYRDLESGPHSTAFRLERLYHSRSRFEGLLGYGWCLSDDLEARLTVSGDGLTLYDCDHNAKLRFERRGPDAAEWIGTHDRRDRIRLVTRPDAHDAVYERRRADGRVQVFDRERGRLQLTHDRRGRPLHLRYDENDRLSEIRLDRDWTRLFFDSPASRLISRLEMSNGAHVTFFHDGDDLIEARSNERTFFYAYDPLHNLREAREDGALRVSLLYDADHDRVTALRDRHGCIAQFSYEGNSLHSITRVSQACGPHPARTLRYDFYYRTAGTALELADVQVRPEVETLVAQ